MPLPIFAQILLSVALNIAAYLLAPKPKQPKPPALADFEDPTAEAGRPIPKPFGSLTIQSPNNMGYWDKEIASREIKVGKK